MLLENKVTFKYYRMIPKGFWAYAKHESSDQFWHHSPIRKTEDAKKKPSGWSRALLRAPHPYRRSRHPAFTELVISDIPPDPRGGMTECYLEILDTDTGNTVVFVGRVKCSNKDQFCYKTGRDMAQAAAYEEYEKWSKKPE